MHVVFTDLDGSLLDARTYSFEAARPTLERMAQAAIPVVFVTSKTRAETEFWRWQMQNIHPFIVENGGALFIPHGYFPFAIEDAAPLPSYDAIELGAPYAELVRDLAEAADAAGCQVRGFADMSDNEVAKECGLPVGQARLARLREYDEPFMLLQGVEGQLRREIEARGQRHTRGGRFHHICGANDKGAAVARAIELYRRAHGEVLTIGLGDAPNDEPFLRLMDQSIMLSQGGPAAWNEAIRGIL
jgi:mannosyl-3-phosphoglycerate phosphatase